VPTRVVEPSRARWNVTLMADNSEYDPQPGCVTEPRYAVASRGPAEWLPSLPTPGRSATTPVTVKISRVSPLGR